MIAQIKTTDRVTAWSREAASFIAWSACSMARAGWPCSHRIFTRVQALAMQ